MYNYFTKKKYFYKIFFSRVLGASRCAFALEFKIDF